MAMRRFQARLTIDLEVDDRLLEDVLTDEWRRYFYPLLSPEDVAGHLAFNLVQGRALRDLDGFADQPSDRVPSSSLVLEMDDVVEIEVQVGRTT